MSANLDLVRSIYADWERGDFLTSFVWAHPEVEFIVADGPEPGSWKGLADLEAAFRERMSAWDDYHFIADEITELDGERVLALNRRSGRGKASGLDIGQMQSAGMNLFSLREGKVTNLLVYWDRERGLADLGLKEKAMPEESTTPDLVELTARLREAANRRDVDSMVSFLTPDAVVGYAEDLGTFEGRTTIRRVWQDWFATFEEFWLAPDETLDLGNGVVFSVAMSKGRPVGSSSEVRQRTASVTVWAGSLIKRVTFYLDIDQARAAAERLAQERG